MAYIRRTAEKPAPFSRVYFGNCKECGQAWSSPSASTRYCSVECRKVFFSRKRLEDGSTRKYVERRRVRKNQSPSETIERLVVAERDQWICGICSRPVDPGLVYPDPMSLSIDHVVPLALGGHHTYANVRASHLDCNIRRGTDVDRSPGLTGTLPDNL